MKGYPIQHLLTSDPNHHGKPLTKEEKAQLAEDDSLAAADDLITRLRALRQPTGAAAAPATGEAAAALSQAMTQAAAAQPTTRIAASANAPTGTSD